MAPALRDNDHEGHRKRLRSRFLNDSEGLSDEELLELILTFAIPRKDLAPLAHQVIHRYGNLWAALSAPADEQRSFYGMGESAVILLKVILTAAMKKNHESKQFSLFDSAAVSDGNSEENEPKERSLRVFANDEVANALVFLPEAVSFSTLQQYKEYLEAKLPYNSAETRRRRAGYLIGRFFPSGQIDTPFFYFLSHLSSDVSLKPAVFYQVLRSEAAAAKIAEELIYPALPSGRVGRNQLKDFIKSFLPSISDSSLKNMLRSVLTTYSLLGVGLLRDEILSIRLHQGDLEGFLYVLTSEFPAPGIYTFDQLYQGPVHRWLLWEKEWIRKQLYHLRDLKIIAKISEIDTVQQFTLDVSQTQALRLFYESIH